LNGKWSGTSRRLFFAFGALVFLYASSSLFAIVGLSQIHDGLERTRGRLEGMRVALDLASAVRDQYAHQAHTIILGNDTHLEFHAEAERHVLDLVAEMRRHAQRDDEKAWVEDIEAATSDLGRLFRERIVPAVLAGRREEVQEAHERALVLVGRIQERTDRLAARFEESIVEFRNFVLGVEERVLRWSVIFLILAPLLAAAVGIYVGRSVARPVARLQQGAERLAGGDLATRIEVDRDDEFGALARQFNAMTAALKEHQDRLVRSEKLAGLGRLAAGVAHEINNPLGVILGYTRILARKAEGAMTEDLAVIEQETLRCMEIVEGLLDLARPPRTEMQRIDLRELCDDVAERLAESGQAGRAHVQVGGEGSVAGDAFRVRQVLFNLVKNAMEAAGDGGHVRVQILAQSDCVEVRVTDDGPGIDHTSRERLFEPFFTTKPRGVGLGLAVSQVIARAHGGEITAADAAPRGAYFTLSLPTHDRGETR